MGNFRHQSTRTTERDREKGSGEDKEAKDGQERLRSVCVTPPPAAFFSDQVLHVSFPTNLIEIALVRARNSDAERGIP